ncbi:MAG: toll/interleukin-1 receptor domain-containing protein [Planctomycetes bacterium]|nr:toll/interleukin-1 receptor domain-containing protein [Planctomycetota bacterium]
MSDIFVSYAKEDRPRAQTFAQALETLNWSVFWDRVIPTGKSWREVIGTQLYAAKCVVVLWSRASVGSRWVIEEAEIGLQRGILIPVLIDDVAPPLGFQSLQAADLSCWDGAASATPYKDLVKDIAAIVGSSSVTERKPQEADVEGKGRMEEPEAPIFTKAEKLSKAVPLFRRVLVLLWLWTVKLIKGVLLLLWLVTYKLFKRLLFWGRVPLLLWVITAAYTSFAVLLLWECKVNGEDVVFGYMFVANALVLIIGSVISSLGRIRALWICGVGALVQIAILVGTPHLVVGDVDAARVLSIVVAGPFVGMMALYAKRERSQRHLKSRYSGRSRLHH